MSFMSILQEMSPTQLAIFTLLLVMFIVSVLLFVLSYIIYLREKQY